MSLRVDTTSKVITFYAGAALLRETARAVGLGASVSQCVHLKERERGLSEAQFVVSMAESIALGARCLDDLAVARGDLAQRELRGFGVPAPQTAGTWLRRFSLGHIRQLDKALASVHRRAFTAMGLSELTLDFDSTYGYSRSTRRQGVDRTYKRAYACTRCSASKPRRASPCTPAFVGGARAPRRGSTPSCARRCAGCPRAFACAAVCRDR